MRKRSKYYVVLIGLLCIVILCWQYKCIESLRLMYLGFPKYSAALDVQQWRMYEAKLDKFDCDTIGYAVYARQIMVNDLLARHEEIFANRQRLIQVLGPGIKRGDMTTYGTIAILGRYNSDDVRLVESRINTRGDSIAFYSTLITTSYDVAYVAGSSASSECILVFFYTEDGDIIDYAWVDVG